MIMAKTLSRLYGLCRRCYQEQLSKRTPKDGVDRKQFINLLVEEYLHGQSLDAKQQVLANLANFAYDPINFGNLKDSGALDIFLHELTAGGSSIGEEQALVHHASSGLCNICLDPVSADYILENDGLKLMIKLLSSENEETILNAITTLIFLGDRVSNDCANNPNIIALISKFKGCSENTRLQNIAIVFLEDVLKKFHKE